MRTFTHKHARGLETSEHWDGKFDSAAGADVGRTTFRCATFTRFGRDLVTCPRLTSKAINASEANSESPWILNSNIP